MHSHILTPTYMYKGLYLESHHTFGSKPCPLCDDQSEELSHFDHFVTCHFPLSISSDRIVELLANESMDIFIYAKHFLHHDS